MTSLLPIRAAVRAVGFQSADPVPPCCDFERESAGLLTVTDFRQFADRWCREHGLPYFIIVMLPLFDGDRLASHSIIGNWPSALVERLDASSAIHDWTCFCLLKTTTRPFSHSLTEWSSRRERRELKEILCQIGLLYGHFFPVHDAQGNMGAVVLGGAKETIGMRSRGALQVTSMLLFSRLAAIGATRRPQSGVITAREGECLIWTAAGKTSAEIAQILRLSENTVNHHLFKAVRKLDTVNRTQAVVVAMRRGLIEVASEAHTTSDTPGRRRYSGG